jgi:hypothetical protein
MTVILTACRFMIILLLAQRNHQGAAQSNIQTEIVNSNTSSPTNRDSNADGANPNAQAIGQMNCEADFDIVRTANEHYLRELVELLPNQFIDEFDDEVEQMNQRDAAAAAAATAATGHSPTHVVNSSSSNLLGAHHGNSHAASHMVPHLQHKQHSFSHQPSFHHPLNLHTGDNALGVGAIESFPELPEEGVSDMMSGDN